MFRQFAERRLYLHLSQILDGSCRTGSFRQTPITTERSTSSVTGVLVISRLYLIPERGFVFPQTGTSSFNMFYQQNKTKLFCITELI